MASVEKVSIALSAELLAAVKRAVQSGDYASSSEVIREALREWKARRGALPPRSADPSPPQSAPAPVGSPADPLAHLQTHRAELEALCRRFAVRLLSLFGSALRDDFDPARSDLDFSVEFGEPPPGLSLERQYFDFKAALESRLQRSVDLVELAAMTDSRLKRAIERTQRLFYEQAA